MWLQPAGMAVHISAGHTRGTLVNALLHHCGLPGIQLDPAHISIGAPGTVGASGALLSLMGGPAASDVDWQAALCAPGQVQACMAEDEEGGGLLEEDECVEEDEIQVQHGAGNRSEHAAGSSGSSSSSSSGSSGVEMGLVQVAAEAGLAPGVLRPGIVHRLDLGTSGLLVVAKREGAQRHLSAQFKARTVRLV